MRTGNVSISGRLAIFVEYIQDRNDDLSGGREVGNDVAAHVIAAGLRPKTCGLRFHTALVDAVREDGTPFVTDEVRVEVGPTILIGLRVSRAYLVALRDSCGIATSDGKAVDSWVRAFDERPTTTRLAHLRNGHVWKVRPEDVAVDETGEPTTDVLDAPVSGAAARPRSGIYLSPLTSRSD